MKMPANPKLIWTTAQCNFCPRTDVRSCVIKSDVLTKLSAALHVENYTVSDATSICTCCFADLDMIIRADAIRSAMLSYYQGTMRWRPPKSNSTLDTTIQEATALSLQAGSPAKPTTILPPNSIDMASVSSQSKMVNNLYFKCLICDKISASKSHCMEHLVRHSNSRPFTCLSCGKTYKSRKACREHIMVIHKLSRHQEVEINEKIRVDAVVYQQMKSICSQYEQLYVPDDSNSRARETRSADNISQTHQVTRIKEEARTDSPEIIDIPDLPIDPQSPATSSSTPSIPAMPLLVKRPSPSYDAPLPFNEKREGSVTPPSSKRGRKGIPQKVSQPEAEEEDLSSSELFCDNIPAFPEPFLKPSTSPILGNASDYNGFSRSRNRTIPPCEICGRQFVTKEKRIDHLRSHSQLKQFSCRVCKRYFKYRRGVTNHLKEVHKYTDRIKISSNVVSHENEESGEKSENGRQTDSPSISNQFSMGLSPGRAVVSPSGTADSTGGDSNGEILVEQDYTKTVNEPMENVNAMEIASLNNDDGMESTNHICMECGEVCDTAMELAEHTKTH